LHKFVASVPTNVLEKRKKMCSFPFVNPALFFPSVNPAESPLLFPTAVTPFFSLWKFSAYLPNPLGMQCA